MFAQYKAMTHGPQRRLHSSAPLYCPVPQVYTSTSYMDDLAHAYSWLCLADGEPFECAMAESWWVMGPHPFPVTHLCFAVSHSHVWTSA